MNHLLSKRVEEDRRRLDSEAGKPIQHQSNICAAEAPHMPSGTVHQLLHQLRCLQLCSWSRTVKLARA